jgi:hypothetical protein
MRPHLLLMPPLHPFFYAMMFQKNTLHRRDYALLLAAFIDAGDVCAGRRVLNHGRGASQSYLQQTNQPAAALLLWLTMR